MLGASPVAQSVKNPPTMKETACKAGDPVSIPGLRRSPGEGNGNPLQYSCLGNPMNRGAQWVTVHGVAKSQTWLNNWVHSTKCLPSLYQSTFQTHFIPPFSFCPWICHVCVCVQLCPTLYNPMDSRLLGFSVHGNFQARILECVAIFYSRGSSWSRDWTHSSCISCIGRWILYHCASREALKPVHLPN